MTKYAAVVFEREELSEQRKFLHAMNGVGVIQLSKEEIDENMDRFEQENVRIVNRFVLSTKDQARDFKAVMAIFFPEHEYKITDNPDDEEFAKWIKEKE